MSPAVPSLNPTLLISRCFVGLLLAAGIALHAGAASQDIDRIVAVVNNAVITQYELNLRVDQVQHQLASQQTTAPPRRILEKQLLERMINEHVLLQIAEDSNIRFDGAAIDRAVARIAEQNHLSSEAFRRQLESEKTDFAAFREQIRSEMTIARLREREVDSKVVVTEAEIDNFLSNPSQEANQQDEYDIAHILILAPEGASPEQLAELRTKAEKAAAELKAGTHFSQVSATYSDAQNALQGGDLGWRSEGQLPTLFAGVVKTLKPGEYSGVIQSPNGYHIVKLIDKRGKNIQLVVKQSHARHILIKTNEVVSDDDARTRLLQLRERIEHGADFVALAKIHSDDLSANRGGDLGWLNPGDTVPEFERAMDALKPGEVSEPIRSPFGWHLIQVLERRDQDVTQERKHMEARRALRERRAEEMFEDWVRQARDRAYVEIRLEE